MNPRKYAPLLAAALAVLALSIGASSFGAVQDLGGPAVTAPDERGNPETRSSSRATGSQSPPERDDAEATPRQQTAEPSSGSDDSGSAPAALVLIGIGLIAAVALVRYLAAGDGGRVTRTEEESTPSPSTPTDLPTPDPENGVEAAWLTLARRVTDQDWPRRTPGEVATAARNSDLPADPVATLSDLFERVRYGAEPATTEREEQANAALGRLSNDQEET